MKKLFCKIVKAKNMKEYLQGRIKQLEKEYSDILTKIGNEDKTVKKVEWQFIEDRKSRIDECRLSLDYLIKNGYNIA